jgi:hypothetical protein
MEQIKFNSKIPHFLRIGVLIGFSDVLNACLALPSLKTQAKTIDNLCH